MHIILTIRTFIAVKIQPAETLKSALSDLGELGRTVRPVRAANLHVTVKFLGDTEETLIPEIAELLRSAAADVDEFLVGLRGLGAFPSARRPSVVWVGMEEADPLGNIAKRLQPPLKNMGFPREQRKFEPHLTIARVRGRAPEELKNYIAQNASTDYGTELLTSIALYKSELHSTGAQYTALEKIHFGQAK